MEVKSLLLVLLAAGVHSYTVYNYESVCGKTLTITKDQPNGVVLLDNKTLNRSCNFDLVVENTELILGIAFKGVDIPDCKKAHLQIYGFDTLADVGIDSQNSEILFGTSPHFCGKKISNSPHIVINDGYVNQRIRFVFHPLADMNGDRVFFEFYYTTSELKHILQWPKVTTITTEIFTPEATATKTSTPKPTTTESTTPKPTTTESTTPKPTTTETSTPKPTTTESTTPKPTTTVTTKATTSRPPIVKYPIRSRSCKCQILVERYGKVEEEKKIDLSYVKYSFVRGTIRDSNCVDQYRCSKVCRDYMDKNLADGLETLRTNFGPETAGDYVCTSVNKAIFSSKPARASVIASIRGCPGERHVTTLECRLCCVGHIHSYKQVDCSKAIANKDVVG